eukprot:gb/GEZN01005036.1/.p1 GENE.gb/GEZN01005036.1/~~gb/GEZN01005036.1/.p1  ORF type:complete len:390 (+),score=51.87 gb/GEZN01005036.1/:559-1728(+)
MRLWVILPRVAGSYAFARILTKPSIQAATFFAYLFVAYLMNMGYFLLETDFSARGASYAACPSRGREFYLLFIISFGLALCAACVLWGEPDDVFFIKSELRVVLTVLFLSLLPAAILQSLNKDPAWFVPTANLTLFSTTLIWGLVWPLKAMRTSITNSSRARSSQLEQMTLLQCIDSKYYYPLFISHLRQEFAVEYGIFLKHIIIHKRLPSQKLTEGAQKIVANFLAPAARFEVTLDFYVKAKVFDVLNTNQKTLELSNERERELRRVFNEAEEVVQVISGGPFVRFKAALCLKPKDLPAFVESSQVASLGQLTNLPDNNIQRISLGGDQFGAAPAGSFSDDHENASMLVSKANEAARCMADELGVPGVPNGSRTSDFEEGVLSDASNV